MAGLPSSACIMCSMLSSAEATRLALSSVLDPSSSAASSAKVPPPLIVSSPAGHSPHLRSLLGGRNPKTKSRA
jgi:hypothetical protein